MDNKLILLVEDNPSDVVLIRRALKTSDILSELVVAYDGADALDFLFGTGAWAGRETSVLPQLVLLDLNLPRIDGFEVLRRIRANPRTEPLPVVMLTSSENEHDLRKAYSLHANSYIRKPMELAEFTSAVQQMQTYWLGLNLAPPQQVGLRSADSQASGAVATAIKSQPR